jgi:hypothetical protein
VVEKVSDPAPAPAQEQAALADAASAVVNDPELAGLLSQVATKMGGANSSDALRRSLRTMLALYDAKAQGGQPVVRYGRTEQAVNLPGAS